MRWLVFAAAAAIVGCASEAPAQTFTTTNCMMTCNSQAATCQTACFVPGTTPSLGSTTPPLLAAQAPGPNTTASTTCVMNCTTTQLTCQTTCAKVAPSQ